jgi:hypothetical protein
MSAKVVWPGVISLKLAGPALKLAGRKFAFACVVPAGIGPSDARVAAVRLAGAGLSDLGLAEITVAGFSTAFSGLLVTAFERSTLWFARTGVGTPCSATAVLTAIQSQTQPPM